MSLLEEIQNEAIDSTNDLGTLLRKCKLLAARLGSQPLEKWLIWESNGYPKEIAVPEYRVWPMEIKGNFYGPFGSSIKNGKIPIASLPQEVKGKFTSYECKQSIASMEQMLQKGESGQLQVSTGDLAVFLGTNVYAGYNCLEAWAEFPIGNVYELFNSVRNRILDFSLEIWKVDPTAGDSKSLSNSSLEEARVTQIFNTTVYGGAANVVGTANSSTISFDVHQGDMSSLEKALREKDIIQEDIDDLKAAIEEDESPVEKDKFGPRVTAWISKMVKKAVEGSWDVGIGIAGSLLAQIISKYYGF